LASQRLQAVIREGCASDCCRQLAGSRQGVLIGIASCLAQ